MNPFYRVHGLTMFLAGLMLATACAPNQDDYSLDQCSDVNVNLVELADAQFEGVDPEIDLLMNDFLAAKTIPGCALGVVTDNEISYLSGYGSRDLGKLDDPFDDVPFTVASPSSVGSISKTITALGVLQLMEQGELDLDDPVSMHLPFASAAWADITIRDLLSHGSGLQREPEFDLFQTEQQLIQQFGGEHPGIHPRNVWWGYRLTPLAGFEPGFNGRYANTNFIALGAMIDFITSAGSFDGVAGYESFIWQNVGFKGSSLSSTTNMLTLCLNSYWRQDDIKNLAKGYVLEDSLEPFPDPWFSGGSFVGPPGFEAGAGGWTMTIGDLARMMIAINTNQLIGPDARGEMMTVTANSPSGPHGLGVFLLDKLNRQVFMHDGAYGGYVARYTMWPDEGIGVALMCNRAARSNESLLRDITDDIGRVLFDRSRAGRSTPAEGRSGPRGPASELATRHRDTLAGLFDRLAMGAEDSATASRNVQKRLLETALGRSILRDLRDGNLDAAARSILELAEDR